jgi:hypothetical protein
MKRNVGALDRTIRLVLGVLILGLYGALQPPLRYLTLLGLIPLGTGLTGNCLFYSLLGISTAPKPPASGTTTQGPAWRR